MPTLAWMSTTTEYRSQLNRRLAEVAAARQAVAFEQQTLAAAIQDAAEALEAQRILQEAAQRIQQQAHARIASVVTRCLRTVFGEEDAYEFRIEFDKKRGKTEARLFFVRDGQEVDPLGAAGGGVVDIAAFALRIVSIMLTRPARRRWIAADEPFRHLSSAYRPAARQLLEALAAELDFQFLLITHDDEFRIGTVIDLGTIDETP